VITMSELCEICGREFGDEPSQCFLRNDAAGLLEEAECYCLGYEREQARADRSEAEFAACKALLTAEQKRAERAEAERAEALARAKEAEEAHRALREIWGQSCDHERTILSQRDEARHRAGVAEQRASAARALAIEEAARAAEQAPHPFSDSGYYAAQRIRALAALPVEPARRQVTENANALGAPAAGCSEEGT
jgi:hypothetical protein